MQSKTPEHPSITSLNNLHPQKAQGKVTAVFQFNRYGLLTTIFLNPNNEDDQKILEKGLSRLLKPEQLRLLRRLFLGHQ